MSTSPNAKVRTKLKLIFMRSGVHWSRKVIDASSVVLSVMGRPIRVLRNRIGEEAPWALLLGTQVFFLVTPYMMLPSMTPYFAISPRKDKERARVRKSLQQGVDPHPYLMHRDFVYNAMKDVKVTDPVQVPDDTAYWKQSVDRFKTEKESLARYDIDKAMSAIDQLEREINAVDTLTGIDAWLAVGLETDAGLEIRRRMKAHRDSLPEKLGNSVHDDSNATSLPKRTT